MNSHHREESDTCVDGQPVTMAPLSLSANQAQAFTSNTWFTNAAIMCISLDALFEISRHESGADIVHGHLNKNTQKLWLYDCSILSATT